MSTASAGCCDRFPLAAVLTYDTEAAISARYGGLGLSVFGALGRASRTYVAAGLTVELGRIH